MKLSKKWIGFAASLTVAVVVLSACGNSAKSGDQASQGSAPAASTTTSSTTAASGTVKTDPAASAAAASGTSKTDPAASAAAVKPEAPSSTASAAPTASASKASAGKVVEVKIMAKDFEYDKTVIHVKKGDKVKITLHSDDGGHGFTIPAYNVTINGNGSAEFTANKTGKFEYHCSVYCGSGHTKMKGTLIVW